MNKKILFVDDEIDILKVSTFRLKKLGYEVLTAENGLIGLEVIRKEKPALVFLDLIMPVMDGYETCLAIKKDAEIKDIPVILFTAVEETRVPTALKETKADGTLTKPFEAEELLRMVRHYVDGEKSDNLAEI